MAAHEYSKACKCRGCVAVTKAKRRAGIIATPLALLSAAGVGFIGGPALGSLAGLGGAVIAVGVFVALNPKSEVLKAESADDAVVDDAPAAKSKVGWTIATGLGVVACIGATAAAYIPAYGGLPNSYPYQTIGLIFWFGILGYFIRKRGNQSGGIGWAVGGLAGLIISSGAGFLHGFQSARIRNAEIAAKAEENVTAMNANLPQMIDEHLRLDRVELTNDELRYHLTFVNETAEELTDSETVKAYKTSFAENICASPEMANGLKAGARFRYIFLDKVSSSVPGFTITGADCQ